MQENQHRNFEVEPIAPGEVTGLKEIQIPGAVFQVFNEMIVEKGGDRRRIVLYQDDIVSRLVQNGLSQSDIYDKPGYNESYRAHFIFSAK